MIKETLVTIALTLGQTPTAIDGDTVKVAGVHIRLTDYDSPELFSPKCPREYALAWQAKRELETLLPTMKLELVPCAFTNYGRLCARATSNGQAVSAHMIEAKLASPMVCRPGYCPPKINWCAP
jgi:endonuclease YncB( thermonuclease family)